MVIEVTDKAWPSRSWRIGVASSDYEKRNPVFSADRVIAVVMQSPSDSTNRGERSSNAGEGRTGNTVQRFRRYGVQRFPDNPE